MPRQRWSAKERAAALEVYREHGAAEAARRSGIPIGTIAAWAHRSGLQTVAPERMRAAVEVASLTLAERRARFAVEWQDVAEKLLSQVFHPCKTYHWGTVSEYDDRGKLCGTRTEFMGHDVPQPSFAEQKAIVSAASIATDKSRVLSGDAVEGQTTTNVLVLMQRVLSDLPPDIRVEVADRLDRLDTCQSP